MRLKRIESPGNGRGRLEMQGIQEWDTKEGIHVLRVHYTADPEKRSKEWKENQKAGMREADWNQEYEIDFDVPIGKPFYPEFRAEFHVAEKEITPNQSQPVGGGWDFGLTPATVHVQVSPKGQIVVLHPEIQSWDAGVLRHGSVVQSARKVFFPECKQYFDYGDPAGSSRVQTDERTCFRLLSDEYQIHVLPGPVNRPEREEPFRDLLTRTTPQGQPMFIIDPRCHWLIAALNGGYCHKQVGDLYIDEPDKNEYSHIVDALLYVVARILKKPEKRKKPKNRRLSGQL